MVQQYRCASLLKPLYAWVAGPTYQPHAERAVIESSNDDTDLLVAACGGLHSTLDRIFERTDVALSDAPTWGSVVVDERDVKQAYRGLLAAAGVGDFYAASVLEMMVAVREGQRFGAPSGLAVKAGWDLSPDEPFIRTHLVAIRPGGDVGVALTGLPISESRRREWNLLLETGGPSAVIPIHEAIAGAEIDARLRF